MPRNKRKSKRNTLLGLLPVFIVVIFLFIPFKVILMESSTLANKSYSPMIIAHRGASGSAPENTLAAVQKALQSDAEMIEIDVHLTKDERVVVIHDETLERTTNGEGEIKHLNYDDIKNLDSGSWFSNEYKDENIPLLSEVIDLVDGRKKLLVEIKSDPKDKSPIATKVVEELIKYDALDWSVIQSFNDHILFEIHEKYPQVKLHKLIVFKFRMLPYALSDKVVKFSVEKYDFVDAINPHFRFVNRHFLKKLHDAGFKVNVWGAKNPNSYDKIKHLPIDGWITDHP